jgi:hypothetical protein
MIFDSETLITSFFPRITKKRAIHTELASSNSSNKRQRGHTSATARQSANEDEQERRNTLDNGIISILHPPSVESTRQRASKRHMSLLPSLIAKNTTSQTPKPNRSPSRTMRKTPSSSSSQMFISSSQSQFLSPVDQNNHPQPSLITPNSELDIIPSSQSQEKELRILNDLEECHQSIRSR